LNALKCLNAQFEYQGVNPRVKANLDEIQKNYTQTTVKTKKTINL